MKTRTSLVLAIAIIAIAAHSWAETTAAGAPPNNIANAKNQFTATPTSATPAVNAHENSILVIASATRLALTINGCGMGVPDANGTYNAHVNAITVNYPQEWKVVSVQRVGEKYLATMETDRSAVVDKYTTFWINPGSREFQAMAKRHIAAEFKQRREPSSITLYDELTIAWVPTDEAQRRAMTTPAVTASIRPAPPGGLPVANQ